MIKPEIALSDLYLNLSVETGSSYYGSLYIYSVNQEELSGFVLSTNDKMEILKGEISGTECEISYHYKGRMSLAGEEHYGDFLLITNGGEFNIPYCINVVPKCLMIDGEPIGTLKEFCRYAADDREKAKEVFFSQEFQEVFLADQEEIWDFYKSLMKGTAKDSMLEQFLIGAAGKRPVRPECDKELIVDEEGKGILYLGLRGEGYVEGKLRSRMNRVLFEKASFQESVSYYACTPISLQLKNGYEEDEVVIDTIYNSITIRVKRKESEGKRAGTKRELPVDAKLLSLFLQFRTGQIPVELYLKKSKEVLPLSGAAASLYDFQLSLVERQCDGSSVKAMECDGKARKIEEKKNLYLKEDMLRSYYYYLQALYENTDAVLGTARTRIREEYEKSGKWTDYILLLMVDENAVKDTKNQAKEFYRFLKEGVTSPILYLAVLDLLNQEPYYLEGFEGYRTALINWAIRHKYLSLELSRQYARMTLKEKQFRKKYIHPLMKLYDRRKEDDYLKTICSLLMKGSKTDTRYHVYFEEAVERDLKLMGLNEYYLRTMDFSAYPVLPQSLMLYFHYSNSLNDREKAYLYTNVLWNKDAYEYILSNYLIRMEQFVKDQMKEGRNYEYLSILYRTFLPAIADNVEYAKYLPNIIFRKKLTCHNPFIEGVYICYQEEEQYIPFVNGSCQIDQFSDQILFYFVDAKGNRYSHAIEYELTPLLKEDEYYAVCMKYCQDNKKVAARWLSPVFTGKMEDLFGGRISMKGWRREKALERILDSHYEKKAMKELSECLDQINYRIINPAYRRTLMNYYMACDRMEDAYFGVELYGSDLMDISQLYLLACVGLYLHKEERDELLLVLVHRSFLFGRYNKEMLLYLRKHFEGRNFDLLGLWSVLKKEGLDTAEYEEKVLNQMLFTGERDERILDVLLSYLEKETNDELARSLLEIYSIYYFVGRKNVPASFFKLLEQQVKKSEVPVVMKLSYLLWKSRLGYRKEEEETIERILQELLQEQIVFDFYSAFLSFAKIPAFYKEATAFYGYDSEGLLGSLELILISDNGETRRDRLSLKELMPGFYYGISYVPFFEQIKDMALYFGAEKGMTRIMVSRMDERVPGSRQDLLRKMEENPQQTGSLLSKYDAVLMRMKRQLRMLGV